jgi:hypothetical protein
METRQLIKMLIGAIAVVTVVMIIAALMPNQAKAELDSDARNPGNDKVIEDTVNEDTVIGDRVTELGTAMKLWAIGFGMEAEKNVVETKQAFLNDVGRFQQSKFWQYQVDGWAQGQQDLANTRESIKQLPQTLARVPGDIATGLVDFVRAVTGVKNANEEK